MKSKMCFLLLFIIYPLTLMGCSTSAPAILQTQPTPTSSAMEMCWEDPLCRLDVSSDQLRSLYEGTSTWKLEEYDSPDGTRVYSVLSHDEQISVQWFEDEGVVLVVMIASVPNAFDGWAAPWVEGELRRLLPTVIPPPYRSDPIASIMSTWFVFDSIPDSRQGPASRVINGVVEETYYISSVPAVGVTFRKSNSQ